MPAKRPNPESPSFGYYFTGSFFSGSDTFDAGTPEPMPDIKSNAETGALLVIAGGTMLEGSGSYYYVI